MVSSLRDTCLNTLYNTYSNNGTTALQNRIVFLKKLPTELFRLLEEKDIATAKRLTTGRVQIFVNVGGSSALTVEANLTITFIGNVVKKVSGVCEIDKENITLIYGGRRYSAQNRETLENIGIKEGSTLMLALKFRG